MSGLKKAALTVAASALLPMTTAAPVWADPASTSATASPAPPAGMSTLGGTRLGQPGTQVDLGSSDAPVLPKQLTGKSWIVADANTGEVLAAHNAHWKLPPASTMKMLFADTLLPKLPSTDPEQHTVTDADLKEMEEGSSQVGIVPGQTYSVNDLWLGVFLRSGNDAVHVLSAMNGGLDDTVKEMNTQAAQMNAHDTHVVTPDGYDEKGQTSSAYDLTLFARAGLQNADFRKYCSTKTAQFPGKAVKGKKRPTFQIQNTNRLLTGQSGVTPYPGIAGVKNGDTTKAGATFTGVAERDGRVLLVTVMTPSSTESEAVYKESSRLLDWGFAADGKVTPVGTLVGPGPAPGSSASAAPSVGPAPSGKPSGRTDGGADNNLATSDRTSTSSVVTALIIVAGVLVVLGAVGYLVNRRWPRRPRG